MIEVNRKDLQQALKLAACVVERRNTIPVLGMLKARANGVLSFEGSDLDSFSRVELAYSGEMSDGAAEFCLPEPARLRTALGHAGGDVVSIDAGQGATESARLVRLASGQLTALLAPRPHEDHPGAEGVEREAFAAVLGAGELAQIARAMVAVSAEPTRYYLNGLAMFKVGEWTWRFVATDGQRLMMADVPLPGASGAIPDGTILPKRWVHAVLAQFARSKDGVTLQFGHRIARNSGNGEGGEATLDPEKTGAPRIGASAQLGAVRLTLSSKLIDGNYPDYTRVIRQESKHHLTVSRAVLAQAVNALSPLASEKTRAVKVTASRGAVIVSLNSPGLSESSFTLPAQHDLPDGFEIGFNGGYLLDMCHAFRGDELVLGLNDSTAPVCFDDPADTAFRAVLMPMRV